MADYVAYVVFVGQREYGQLPVPANRGSCASFWGYDDILVEAVKFRTIVTRYLSSTRRKIVPEFRSRLRRFARIAQYRYLIRLKELQKKEFSPGASCRHEFHASLPN